MKKIRNILALMLAAAMLLTACKKEPVFTYLDTVNFPTGAGLTATASNIILTSNNKDSSVISFSWPSVTFKIPAPVNYELQLTLPSDTIGTGSWSRAVAISLGDDVLSTSLKGAELNVLASTKLNLPLDISSTVAARVVAKLDRKIYSNIISFTVKPFKALGKLFLPGGYQGWLPAVATTIKEVDGRPKMFEGYVQINGPSYEFKMTPQPGWTPTAYGDLAGTSGNISEANFTGGNMSVTSGDGYYYITADFNSNKWTATKTTWSIIGDATPGGWGNDTQMAYDATAQVWKVTANMNAGGSFKFRANNAWKLDFGVDNNGKLLYADNPFLGFVQLNNLTVPSSGNYTITLDLHEAGNYTYKLQKN